MKKMLIWILAFLLAAGLLFGLPALLLATWSWRIDETAQWPALVRVMLMILLPVIPLVFWYSRQK